MALSEVAGRRQRRVETQPIRFIHGALLVDRQPGKAPIRVSKAASSVFSQIVSICVAQATGEPEREHERAIKAYLKDTAEAEAEGDTDGWDEYRDDTNRY
jgi:hypothetical protein